MLATSTIEHLPTLGLPGAVPESLTAGDWALVRRQLRRDVLDASGYSLRVVSTPVIQYLSGLVKLTPEEIEVQNNETAADDSQRLPVYHLSQVRLIGEDDEARDAPNGDLILDPSRENFHIQLLGPTVQLVLFEMSAA
ncbi:MAG: hypothetical protein ABI602_01715 [Candidatus Saccharibacteria bacterium]